MAAAHCPGWRPHLYNSLNKPPSFTAPPKVYAVASRGTEMAGEQWLKFQAVRLCQRLPWCPWAQGAIDSSSAPPAPSCCRAGSAPLLSMAAAAYSLPFSREASVHSWCCRGAGDIATREPSDPFVTTWKPPSFHIDNPQITNYSTISENSFPYSPNWYRGSGATWQYEAFLPD